MFNKLNKIKSSVFTTVKKPAVAKCSMFMRVRYGSKHQTLVTDTPQHFKKEMPYGMIQDILCLIYRQNNNNIQLAKKEYN